MCVAYLRMDEHQALPVIPEGSSESVHGPAPEQAPPAAYPIMQEFMQMMRNMNQPPAPVGNVVDETYERIRKQSAKAFMGTTDPAVAEEWLRGTERILDRFDCTTEKKVSYASSLFEQDALDWWETVPGSRNVPPTLTWAKFLRVLQKNIHRRYTGIERRLNS